METNSSTQMAGIGWLVAIGSLLAAFAIACIFALVGYGQAGSTTQAALSEGFAGEAAPAIVATVGGDYGHAPSMNGGTWNA